VIRLENLTKVFYTSEGMVTAADKINMEVPTGEICVLLGPSGCGKTTTLKMINRIVAPSSGIVYLDGQDTTSMNTVTLRRNIGYVIQQIGLFPNMTIEENIAIVPKMLGWDSKRYKARARELLEIVGLDANTFLKRYPDALSGGQQQRVGVIRALAADPPVMLMDEPFGAIDPINREVIQNEFLSMQKALRKTILFVSHDIDEAVKMGDKIAIFRAGKLEQMATPDTLLAHPKNTFVAEFVGVDRTLKRLQLVKAGEVYRPEPCFVKPGDSLSTALGKMNEAGYRSIICVNARGEPIGLVRRGTCDMIGQGTVAEHLDGLEAIVSETDDLKRVVSEMFREDTVWLPVVNKDGIYCGDITQRAITHHLGATYRAQG